MWSLYTIILTFSTIQTCWKKRLQVVKNIKRGGMFEASVNTAWFMSFRIKNICAKSDDYLFSQNECASFFVFHVDDRLCVLFLQTKMQWTWVIFHDKKVVGFHAVMATVLPHFPFDILNKLMISLTTHLPQLFFPLFMWRLHVRIFCDRSNKWEDIYIGSQQKTLKFQAFNQPGNDGPMGSY